MRKYLFLLCSYIISFPAFAVCNKVLVFINADGDEERVHLCTTRDTIPSLAVDIDGTTYYANMTDSEQEGIYIKIDYEGTEYWVYSNEEAQECVAGQYQYNYECRECGIGTYSSTNNATACTPCANGYTTNYTGSTSSNQCVKCPGYDYVKQWQATGVSGPCRIIACKTDYTFSNNTCVLQNCTGNTQHYGGSWCLTNRQIEMVQLMEEDEEWTLSSYASDALITTWSGTFPNANDVDDIVTLMSDRFDEEPNWSCVNSLHGSVTSVQDVFYIYKTCF